MSVNGIITQEQIQQLVDSKLVNNQNTLKLIDSQRERELQAKTELEEVRSAAVALEDALDTLKDSDTFYSSMVTSSDTSIVTAEAGSNTSLTSYDITNITMAKAAQKVSSSTLGLSDATSAYYESTASVLDNTNLILTDNGESLADWTLNQKSGTVQETVYDGNNVYDYSVSSGGSSWALTTQDMGAGVVADEFTVEIRTNFADLGHFRPPPNDDNSFRLKVDNDAFRLDVRFGVTGMFIMDSESSAIEIGTDIVSADEWNDWKFEVNASDPNNALVSIYKDNVLVASDVSAGYAGDFSATDGEVLVGQYGFANTNQVYVDSLTVSPTNMSSGMVNENFLLDNSEGSTNLAGGISNGYFELNGQRINIDTTKDTLMEVLSKINAAETGVTATWDDSADKIRLTVDEGGEQTIDFGSDTSGFLAAMNINTSAPTASGVESAWDRELDQVAALSAIGSGYFNINGITFDVDTSVDSLQDIINDINGSNAGVSAYYEKSLDKVVMTSTETGENITFGNDTSNFLATIMGDLNEATYTKGSADVNGQTIEIDSNEFEIGDVKFKVHAESVEGASVTIARDTEKATAAIEDFVTKYNDFRLMIDEKTLGGQPLSGDRTMRNIENNLRHFVLNPVSNTGSYDFLRDIGVEYKRGRLSLNQATLEDAFRTDPSSVGSLFGFDSNGDGLRDDGGLSNVMKIDFLNDITSKYTGDIGRKNKLIEARIDKLNNDYRKYEDVIANKSVRLYAEYERFAEAVNQMTAQFQAFQAQMSQLNQLTASLYGGSGGF